MNLSKSCFLLQNCFVINCTPVLVPYYSVYIYIYMIDNWDKWIQAYLHLFVSTKIIISDTIIFIINWYKFLYRLQFTINLTIFHFHMSDATMKNQLLSSCYLSVHFKHHCRRYNINDYRCRVLISTAIATSITDGNTAMYNTIARRGWCNILSQQ